MNTVTIGGDTLTFEMIACNLRGEILVNGESFFECQSVATDDT